MSPSCFELGVQLPQGSENESAKPCYVIDLGRMDYGRSLIVQDQIVERRKKNEIPDCLLFVEYPHVITLGKMGKIRHLLVSELELRKSGVEFFPTHRGGDITYHGPGQLVVYPVLDLKNRRRDIDHYLRDLESCIVITLGDFGILARRIPGATGVWVGEEKIAAIGIRTSQWICSHGLALNVSTDLSYFTFIVPCGLDSKSVTSMSKLLGIEVAISQVKERFSFHFGKMFERSLNPVSPFPWIESSL
jgi:lipoyl(octanoyl) transferase